MTLPLRAVLILVLVLLTAWLLGKRPSSPDLVVYGATPQGVTAAVAAARRGLRVLLVEPSGTVGGVLTRGWLATLDSTNDARGRPIYGGLFREFFRGLAHDPSFDVGTAEGALRGLLAGAGVRVQFGTRAARAEQRGGWVRAVEFRRGREVTSVTARWWIDASDTADLAALAGASFTLGREDTRLDRRQMAATLVFRLVGVPWPAVVRALREEGQTLHDGAEARGRSGYGFGPLAARYVPSRPGRFHLRGLNLARQDDGSLLVNALLITGVDGTNPLAVARARQEAAAEVPRVVAFLRGAAPDVFGTAAAGGVAPELYLRESRHLRGLERLRADSVLFGASTGGSVAVGGYPLDGQIYVAGERPYLLGVPWPYEVPFGTLVPQGLQNLLVVSQAASFGSVAAFSARVVPLQMALGEAAGTAASLAAHTGLTFLGLARWPLATRLLQLNLTLHGARVRTWPNPHGSRDPQNPNFGVARDLLERGLFGGPADLQGQFGLATPVLLEDMLASLNHWEAARGRPSAPTWKRWGPAQTQRPLTVAGARRLLAPLAGGTIPGQDGHLWTRGDLARALWGVIRRARPGRGGVPGRPTSTAPGR